MDEWKLPREELVKRGHWLRERALSVSSELLDLLRDHQALAPPWALPGDGGSPGLGILTIGTMFGRYLARRSDVDRSADLVVDGIWNELRSIVVEAVRLERERMDHP